MKLKSAIKHHMALTTLVLIVLAIVSYIGVVWWSFEAYRAYKDRKLLEYPESMRGYIDIWYQYTIYGRIAGYATAALLFVIGAIMIVFSCMSILNAVKKVNRKTVFAVAYIVCALIAFGLFFNYSYSQFEEYDAVQRAEWVARGFSAEFYDGYVREGMGMTVYGRNVMIFGPALIFGGLIGALVLRHAKKRRIVVPSFTCVF